MPGSAARGIKRPLAWASNIRPRRKYRLNLSLNQEVEAAVAAGVIQNFDPNSLQYQCVVCSRAGCGDVLPHILSKEHKNSLIWEAIRQSPPSKALLNQMPDVVRAAKLNEEVGAVDKNHFSYRCNICYGKKPFNGVAPLEAHLRGKEHEKSKRNMQYTTHCARTVGEPVQVTAPMQKGSFHLSSFANQTSEYGIPNARASPPEADQHVHAPTPTAGAWLGIPHPPLLSPTDLQRERGGLTMPKTFDSMGKESLSPEAVEAIHSGIVSTSNGLSYYCNACQVPLTGARPLVQHVEGERHKKTARMTLYRQEFPNIAGLTLSPDPKTRLNNPSIVPPADKKIDGKMTFPWTVIVCRDPIQPSEKIYRNLSFPRGLVSIFNYQFSGEHMRFGAKRDTINLKTLFTMMGYRVEVYDDLTGEGTLNKLRNIQSDECLKDYDSFILIVLSHGKEDTVFYTNGYGPNQMQEMSLNELRNYFTDKACPSLKSKPKIFLANFCRGKLREESRNPLTSDFVETSTEAAPQDMTTIYASINNFGALRDPEKGTVFVQSLCEVLAKHSHNTQLADLYLELCKTMKDKDGTTPENQLYNFKHFYFNPVN
ncbi:uncharacterized protein [Procambarus clarkii]|uniref:uncharacterized protein isoform X4 n=1 Tax=Procambarus clarkii TaxID=6728 RepID=UPI003741FFFC